MNLDIRTLAFILSLTSIAQVIAIFIQFRVNRIYRGVGWWLLGSAFMALGFILLTLGSVKIIGIVAMFGNPMLILGRICLFIGTVRFLGKKENAGLTISTFIGFVTLYYYYMFGNDNISGRTAVVAAAVAVFSMAIAYHLFFNINKNFSGSARFTGSIFLVHATYLTALIFYTLFSQPIRSYIDYAPIQIAAFIVPTITSTLWTFGFILMVNQRLSSENLEEKENLQRVYNSMVRNISERKVAEEALRESEETYRSILSASPDDITITDLEGGIIMVSPAANAMFGYEPGEEFSLRLLDFLVPEDQARARSNILLMHQGGHPAPKEYRGVRKDRSIFDIDVKSGFIRDIHGNPIKMVFIVRDISARKQAEADRAALEVQNRQLQKAESLGRMAGAIAHHFNNKLQSVMANLELASGLPAAMDPTKYLIRAKQATQKAAAVSMQMLVYLGQTSGKREPRFLAKLCHDSLALIRGGLPADLSLVAACPSPGPVISADADQIHQVLTHLVANAWEAMGESTGCIRLGLSTCSVAEIPTTHRFPIDWQPQGLDHACLEVADPGCGIAEADIEKLFDPFFSTKFTGRGLGLPVVLGIVQSHGGAVTVESQLGQGSAFRIYFPVSTEAMPSLPEVAVQAAEPEGGGTVLLVDDDEFLLMATGALIEMMGFTLLTAKDGVEAVEVFRQHQGDIRCVITDLTMPRMDGWETLTALRQLEPTLPVILTSGYDKAQVMSGAHADRPQAYLSKPFRLQQLRDAVGQALGGQRTV